MLRDRRHQRVGIGLRCARTGGRRRSPARTGDRRSSPAPARRSRRRRRRRRRRCGAASVLTSMNFITGSVHIRWRLTASWFGNMRCARLWLMITTGSLSCAIGVVEVAAGDDRHAERGEEARRDRAELRPRILLAVRLGVALGGELEAGAEGAGVAPRHLRADRDALDAGQRGDPPHHFLVEADDLVAACGRTTSPARSAPARCAVWKPVRAACSANSVVSSMPAPASSTNDAAICVTANSAQPAVGAGRDRARCRSTRPRPPRRLGDGRRGTNASSTAATSASPTPTHSRLASTRQVERAHREARRVARQHRHHRPRDQHAEDRAGAAEQQALGQQRAPQRATRWRRAPRESPARLRGGPIAPGSGWRRSSRR